MCGWNRSSSTGNPSALSFAPERGVERLQPVGRAVEAQPEDARLADVREDAEVAGSQVEGGLGGDDRRQPQPQQLDPLPRLLAEEVERQVGALRRHPPQRPPLRRKLPDQPVHRRPHRFVQRHGQEHPPWGIQRVAVGRADLGHAAGAAAHGG
jgi:hypothetical protein